MGVSKVLAITAVVCLNAFATTNQFRGVNWADKRDNFVSDVLLVSGISFTDTYESASVIAERVVGEFVRLLGTNSVRLPINEPTVSSFWSTYTGVIDVALTKGRVVLGYWGPSQPSGPKSMDDFWAMWAKVVKAYGGNPNAYFEIFNEPHMYKADELRSLYATWLEKFPEVPRDHVILDGSGLAWNIPDIADDSRFDGCFFAVHDYSFWASIETESGWRNHFKGLVGKYSDRTICTEWGGPMGAGSKNGVYYDSMDYNQSSSNFFMAYIRGMTEQLREWQMGSFYWVGLRDGDWYSMTKRTGEGDNIKLEIVNQSGVDRMHYSWTDTVEVVSLVQEPYEGEPALIPGKIQIENYDLGGNQVAYYDKDADNKDGEYRKDGVDITKDSTGNYIVGYTEAGEWLEYTVNVKAKGMYNVSARVSSGSDNSSFILFIDGKTISDTIKVPNGGNWTDYTEVLGKTLEIAEGSHVLKILITGNYVNMDWIEFKDNAMTNIENRPAFKKGTDSGQLTYDVFDFCGKYLGMFKSSAQINLSKGAQEIVRKSGIYLVKSRNRSEIYKISVIKEN